MCNKPISLCCIFVVNLVALILCVVAFSFTIWAHSTNKLDILQGVPGLELKAKDVDTIYYVAYGIFGGLAVVCIIGIVACCCCQKCCMTVYAILVIIIKIAMIALFIGWIIVFAIAIAKLEGQLDDLLLKYQSEYATNKESIATNLLQIVFDACGVDGSQDYNDGQKTPEWQKTKKDKKRDSLKDYNFDYPLTCCAGLDDVKDLTDTIKNDKFISFNALQKLVNEHKTTFDQCKKNPPDEGLAKKIKNFLGIVMGIGCAIFVCIIILLILLVCAACNVIKKGPKKDKWSKKYEGKEGGDK
ncbi:uncharacterized protein LOC142356217 [Convolutriloba macropyga]|uniref:uncharacterized protein LOC142356217 n=1 Tax=Convolutriloba macropyga TaxID=536237 RepID=UPI003F5263F6